VVPLVFKTSLGIVRSPEGSTPSLLRQTSAIFSAPDFHGTQAMSHVVHRHSPATASHYDHHLH
jgi:hypothetical protein